MTRKIFFPALLGGLLLGATGCETLTSPNFNFGDLDELTENPTPSAVNTALVGLLIGNRVYYRNPNDYVSMLGILGRESYNNDIADPRFESEMLGGNLQPSSPAFGGNFWAEPYANIRLATIALDALSQLADADYPASDKEWARGFAKTLMAMDFLALVNTRDTNCGCAIEILPTVDDPAPGVSKDQVFGRIVQLLDEAAGHLQAASGPAPFGLSSGFDGIAGSGAGFFNDADNFLEFNQGLRARVAVYMMDFNAALQALALSFLDTSLPFEFGVYHAFSTLSGDELNQLFQPAEGPRLRLHPVIKGDVELKADGTPDDRFVRKVRKITSNAYQGLCNGVPADAPDWPPDPTFKENSTQECDVAATLYNSTTAPIAIMKNEELILLRAEANIGLGNLAAAEADINFVRTNSGLLDPVVLTAANALDRLLYEKHFSLLYEGGHRWIDLRRYNMLNILPLDKVGHQVNAAYPIPIDETAAGGG